MKKIIPILLISLFLSSCKIQFEKVIIPTSAAINSSVAPAIAFKVSDYRPYAGCPTLMIHFTTDAGIVPECISTDSIIKVSIKENSYDFKLTGLSEPTTGKQKFTFSGEIDSFPSYIYSLNMTPALTMPTSKGNYHYSWEIASNSHTSAFYSDSIEVIENGLTDQLIGTTYSPLNGYTYQDFHFATQVSLTGGKKISQVRILVGLEGAEMNKISGNDSIATYYCSKKIKYEAYYGFIIEVTDDAGIKTNYPDGITFKGPTVHNQKLVTDDFDESFEDDSKTASMWYAANSTTTWRIGTPADSNRAANSAYRGEKCLGNNLFSNGLTTITDSTYFYSPLIKIKDTTEIIITYALNKLKSDGISLSSSMLEISTDFVTWHDIKSSTVIDSTEQWKYYSYDLKNLCEGKDVIQLRTQASNKEICFIDEIAINKVMDYMFSANIENTMQAVLVDDTIQYRVSIENRGAKSDSYTFEPTTSSGWITWVEDTNGNLISNTQSIDSSKTTSFNLCLKYSGATETSTNVSLKIKSVNDTNIVKNISTAGAVITEAGGPDSFGYTWINSLNNKCTKFNWLATDESEKIFEYSQVADNRTEIIKDRDIGFNFNFYGDIKSTYSINEYGTIGFSKVGISKWGGYMPSSEGYNDVIAFAWGGFCYLLNDNVKIYQKNSVINGSKVMILTFINIENHSLKDQNEPTIFDVQLIISETGNITMQYKLPQGREMLQSSTVGIENSTGTDGLTYQNGINTIDTNWVVSFIHPEAYTISNMIPENGNSNVSQFTPFSWTNPAGTMETILALSKDDDDFTSSETFTFTGSIQNYTPSVVLDGNSTYYWKVATVVGNDTIYSKTSMINTIEDAYLLQGKVTDQMTGVPIEGAIINTLNEATGEANNIAITDSLGEYSVYVPFYTNYYGCYKLAYNGWGSFYNGSGILDIEMMYSPMSITYPQYGAINISPSTTLCWENSETPVDSMIVWIALNGAFDDKKVLYSGKPIETTSFSDVSTIMPGHPLASTYYYWQIETFATKDDIQYRTLSHKGFFATQNIQTAPLVNFRKQNSSYELWRLSQLNNYIMMYNVLSGKMTMANDKGDIVKTVPISSSINTSDLFKFYFLQQYSENIIYGVAVKSGNNVGDEIHFFGIDTTGEKLWDAKNIHSNEGYQGMEWMESFTVDSNGYAYIVSSTNLGYTNFPSGTDLKLGDWDVIARKYSPTGVLVWKQQYEHHSCLNSNAASVIIEGNLYLANRKKADSIKTGDTELSIYKVNNTTGAKQKEFTWAYTDPWGTKHSNYPKAIIEGKNKSIIVTGLVYIDNDPNLLGFSTFVMKLDSDLNQVWAKTYALDKFPYGYPSPEGDAIAKDGDGYVISGHPELVKINEDGEILWTIPTYKSEYTKFQSIFVTDSTYILGGSDVLMSVYKDNKNFAPRIIATLDTIFVEENSSKIVNLSNLFQDNENITFKAISEFGISTTIHGSIAEITPDTDWNGLSSVTFTATDESGLSQEYSVNIKVEKSNVPPLIDFATDTISVSYVEGSATLTIPVINSDNDSLYGNIIGGDVTFYTNIINNSVVVTWVNSPSTKRAFGVIIQDEHGASDTLYVIIDKSTSISEFTPFKEYGYDLYAAPNPINSSSNLSYVLYEDGDIEMVCYKNGKELFTIKEFSVQSGLHTLKNMFTTLQRGSYYLLLKVNGERKYGTWIYKTNNK